MTSNAIDIPDLARKLVTVGGKECRDPALNDVIEAGKAVDATVARGEALQAVFGASVSAAIQAINGPDDKDPDGVVGTRPEDARGDTVDWQPQIAYAPADTWLKYSIVAKATAKATAKIGMAGGKLSGERELRVLCYRRHDPSDKVGAAVVADLAALASPLAADDLGALGVRDAVALRIPGTLDGALTVSWADIFSSSLKGIAEALGAAGNTFRINVSAGASATFSVKVEDDFALCISREAASGPETFRVALRKAVSHDTGFEAKAGFDIGLDAASVDAVLDNVLGGLLDIEEAALTAIQQATSRAQVPDKYKSVVEALAKRYGIDAADPLAPLKAKITSISDTLKERIGTLAKSKVELGLQYEYLRMSGNTSLLEATMSGAALARLHPALLAFDFKRLLANQEAGVQLRHFLHEQTIKRVQAWGFSLGIGTWLKVVSRQTRERQFVERRYVSGEIERVTQAFLGSTSYKSAIQSWSSVYGAELKADLVEAHRRGEIRAGDLQCGLHLWWEDNKLAPSEDLAKLVDDAVLWGVVRESARAELQQDLSASLAGVPRCMVRFDALLDADVMRAAVAAIRDTELVDWGRHSARALPWRDMPARLSCETREQVYSRFFATYMRVPEAQESKLRTLIKANVEDNRLGRLEADSGHPLSLFAVLFRSGLSNGAFWERWRELRSGAGRTLDVLAGQGEWRSVGDAFGDMQRVFEQTYLIRAVASRLAEHSHAVAGQGLAHGASMTIGYGDRRIVVGGQQ